MRYPHLSERCARVFAVHSLALRTATPGLYPSISGPMMRTLAERYRKASQYLYSRIGR